MTKPRGSEKDDQYSGDDRESRVAYVLARALSLSDELKTTVHELSDMLQSSSEEGGSDHSE